MNVYLQIAFAGLALGAIYGISWYIREIKDHLKEIADQLTIANNKK